MSTPIIVLCAGGHAKVLINVLLECKEEIISVVDQDPRKHGSSLLGIKVMGGDELVLSHPPESIQLVNGLGSVDTLQPRRLLFEKFKQKGYRFATVIHPSAVVAREVTLGEGVQIMAGVVIQPGVSIDADTIINTAASIDHDCRIGTHTHIAPGAVLSGGVCVGSEVHLGTAAAATHGVEIGDRALVAAGSIVTRNIGAGCRVAGIPAREFSR